MGKTKNLDQLLKELNEMQMQFDNLKAEVTTTDNKQKKKQIKTKLASNNIDNDFFSTLATAPKINEKSNIKELDKQLIKQKDLELKADDLLFSLDIEHDEISDKTKSSLANDETLDKEPVDVVNNNLDDDDSKDSEISTSKSIADKPTEKITSIESTQNKEDIINTNIQELKSTIEIDSKIIEKKTIEKVEEKEVIPNKVSEKSYLSIKQKLDRIKQEIESRELELNTEKSKVISIIPKDSNNAIAKEKILTPQKEGDVISKKVLAPKKEAKIEKEKPKNNTVKLTKKVKKNKTSTDNNIDILTLIILILLITLIITAWFLLK